MSRTLVKGVVFVVVLVGIYGVLSHLGALEILGERAAFRAWIDGLGPLGPLAVVGTMTMAIVFTPIPSAPIALASGAAYGHGWGALYIPYFPNRSLIW